jgi:hypothetical protein
VFVRKTPRQDREAAGPTRHRVAADRRRARGRPGVPNSLNGPFILDDQNSIVGNAAIRHVASVGDVLHQHDTPIAGRPIAA